MATKTDLGRDDWTAAALTALCDQGLKGVAVEALARTLHVTKGSFYWHFDSRDALLSAAVERWEQTQTEALIAAASAVADPRERLVQLVTWAHRSRRALRLSRALSAAAEHPMVGPGVRRVAKRRLQFLGECFEAIGLAGPAASHAARMVYASYLGLSELDALGLGLRSKAEQQAYLGQLLSVLAPVEAPSTESGRAASR